MRCPSSHRRELPEGHFSGANRPCRAGATWCRWGSSPSALGVVPGTATTMVKALAESGLVEYEPYAGVRLTAAGEKLAALVLRRHRLIELFLVKVMGMSWTEVHDEAEHLEHAVSDRLIERIDEMLAARRSIRTAIRSRTRRARSIAASYDSLLTCPLDAPVTVTRVSDQDREFLRFVERHELKPGESSRSRSATGGRQRAAARRRRSARHDRRARRVEGAGAGGASRRCSCLLAAGVGARADAGAGAASRTRSRSPTTRSWSKRPSTRRRASFRTSSACARWTATGTRRSRRSGRVGSQTHQFSYTLPWLDGERAPRRRRRAARTIAIRRSRKARTSGVLAARQRWSCRPAIDRGLGHGSCGLQVNLPFSKQHGDWYWHWNARLHLAARAKRYEQPTGERRCAARHLSPFLAGSAIYRAAPDVAT